MAVAAQIGDLFIIRIALDGSASYTVTNPGRTFRIVAIRAFNEGGGGDLTVSLNARVVRVTTGTTDSVWVDSVLVEAECNAGDGDNIVALTAGGGGNWAAGSAIHVYCVPTGGGQTLTAS